MSAFAFSVPVGDSAVFDLTLTDADGSAPNLTGWAVVFTAGTVTKTSAAGQVAVSAPGNLVAVTIAAGDFAAGGTLAASLVATSGGSQKTWFGTVVVETAAGPGDLTTLAKVRDHLGGGESTSGDAILAQLITSSSAWVVSQLGREVLLRAVLEPRDGNGTCRLLLREFPVNSIAAVTIDGETIPQQTATGGDGWALRDDGIDLFGWSFTCGRSNVIVAYTAGYATVPADLEQAVIEHVALRYLDRKRIGMDSMSVGGESAQFGDSGTFSYIVSVLDTYRELGAG